MATHHRRGQPTFLFSREWCVYLNAENVHIQSNLCIGAPQSALGCLHLSVHHKSLLIAVHMCT